MISVKNLVFGIAIFILTLFVGMYGISTFYGESPQYEDYCPQNVYYNQTACETEGGAWVVDSARMEVVNGKPAAIGGYCQYDFTSCQESYDAAQEVYSKKVFYIALPLGVIVVVAGALIFGLEFVGAGLMAGGVAIIVYGAGNYWRFADSWLKFGLSLIGLIVIIWFAYYWTKRMERKRKK